MCPFKTEMACKYRKPLNIQMNISMKVTFSFAGFGVFFKICLHLGLILVTLTIDIKAFSVCSDFFRQEVS